MEPRWLSFALIIFGILAFLEVQVASKWVTAYYRHGIRVFVKQYRIVQPEKFKLCIQRLQSTFVTQIKRYTEIAELSAKSLSQGRLVPDTAEGNQQNDV